MREAPENGGGVSLLYCRTDRSGLIVSKLLINQIETKTVIDTGASASFLPREGLVLKGDRSKLKPTTTRTRVADNGRLDCTYTHDGKIGLGTQPEVIDCARFFVINGTRSILGYDALMGTDLIKQLGISIVPAGNTLEAWADGHVVGREDKYASWQARIGAVMEESATQLLDMLLKKNRHVFADYAHGVMKTPPMKISLESRKVLKARLRRQSPEDILEIKKQIEHMLDRGIIEPSVSQFSANCHLVPKKTGQKRLVINYIPLNRVAVKDHYPLPQVADLLAHLSQAKVFCALDCTEGFWQIPIDKEDCHKTAFVTPQGLFQFTRCPFGFTNSPAVYQRAMNEIFADGLYSKCLIYIDDILVYGKTVQETLDNLTWVLDRCSKFDVKLKQAKCQFLKTEIKFLGYVISENSISPQRSKCDNWEKIDPTCTKDAQSLLGSFNYYARFIRQFSEKTKPLREAIKSYPFIWTDECQRAKDDILQELRQCEAQRLPQSTSNKIVEIGALPNSMEACCLTDKHELIRYTSASLSNTQKNYTDIEKELLALVRAYDTFGPILKGPVKVITSCEGVNRTLKLKEKPERITRILLQLPPDADFEIIVKNDVESALKRLPAEPQEVFYTDGSCTENGSITCRGSWAVVATINPELSNSGVLENSSNQRAEIEAAIQACLIAKRSGLTQIMIVSDSQYVVGALTKWIANWRSNGWTSSKRKPVENIEALQRLADAIESLEITAVYVKGHSGNKYNELADQMAKEALNNETIRCAAIRSDEALCQGNDAHIRSIKQRLEDGQQVKNYTLKGGKVWYEGKSGLQLVIPTDKREFLLRLAHEDPIYGAHQGIKKTRRKLADYYWEGIYTDVERHVRSCNICQQTKARKTKPFGLLIPIKTAAIFDRIHIDIVGPITETLRGNKYVITMIDAFSRYGMAKACPAVSADDIIRFLYEEVIQRHGPPKFIVTDNGTQFKSERFQAVVKRLDIKHSTTCEYHPQSNGMDERFNATLMKLVRNFIGQCVTRWDVLLPWATLAYNLIVNESTRTSPYTILYGRKPRGPVNIHDQEASPNEVQHEAVRNEVNSNSEAARREMEKQYNRQRVPVPPIEMMDLVLTKAHNLSRITSKKLWPKWTGPHCVMRVIKHNDIPVAVEVLDAERFRIRRIPFCDVRLFTGGASSVETDELPGEILMETLEVLYDVPMPAGGVIAECEPMPSGGGVRVEPGSSNGGVRAEQTLQPGDEPAPTIEVGQLDRELDELLRMAAMSAPISEATSVASQRSRRSPVDGIISREGPSTSVDSDGRLNIRAGELFDRQAQEEPEGPIESHARESKEASEPEGSSAKRVEKDVNKAACLDKPVASSDAAVAETVDQLLTDLTNRRITSDLL